MRRQQRRLHLDRRNVGAGADDDVFLARYEPKVVAIAAPYQIAGVVPAGLQALLGCGRIAPVAGENIGAANQELADLATRNVGTGLVDQPDLRSLHDPDHRSIFQAEGQP